MKPTSKQRNDIHGEIVQAFQKRRLSYADLARLSDVDPSQASRICKGEFKTFSNNVVQICRVLGVKVPRLGPDAKLDQELAKAQASMKRICSRTPKGAILIRRVLDAIADLQTPDPETDSSEHA